VLLDNVVKPETFNIDKNVVSFLKVESPLTFNIPLIVVLLDIVVIPETFNEDMNVVPPLSVVQALTFNLPLMVVLFDNNTLYLIQLNS
jgi:hypothetical protein